ncbi:MAG: bifunctional DNA primase/polymerase [Hyphomicrobiaceae bacterium]
MTNASSPNHTSIRSEAKKLALRGFKVFAIRADKKYPLRRGWQDEATDDAFTVLETFPEDANIGIACGEDFTVIDADAAAGGLEGVKTLKLPRTFSVRTAGGGLHYYFRTPQGCAVDNSVRKLAQGVDVRGRGGLVVAPGSRVGGKEYVIEDDAPIAELPAEIIAKCRKAREREKTPSDVVRDPPGSRERGEAFIRNCPECHEGERSAEQTPGVVYGRDNAATAVAMRLYDFAVSRDTCRELLDVWNEKKCSPPLDDDALDRIAGSAEKSKQDAIGRDDPTRAFDIVEPAPNELVADSSRPRLFSPGAARWKGKLPERIPFVVDRLIPRGFVTLLVSAGGRGKSTLAQQLISCVASGKPFLGFPVLERGSAAGIFCEDAEGTLHARQLKICAGLGEDLEALESSIEALSYVGAAHELWRSGKAFTPMLDEIDADITEKGNVRLLVLDGTSHLYSGSEIDRSEVTKFIAGLTRLATKHAMAIVLITHESKSTADSDTHAASGSTAWINAARSVLKLNPVKEADDTVRELLHIKSNLSKREGPIRCALREGFFVLLASSSQRARECRQVAEDLIHTALSTGENLSPKPRAGNFAPKWLVANQQGRDFSEAEFKDALAQLLASTFVCEEYVTKGGGKKAQRIGYPTDPDGSRTVTVADGSGPVGPQPS